MAKPPQVCAHPGHTPWAHRGPTLQERPNARPRQGVFAEGSPPEPEERSRSRPAPGGFWMLVHGRGKGIPGDPSVGPDPYPGPWVGLRILGHGWLLGFTREARKPDPSRGWVP